MIAYDPAVEVTNNGILSKMVNLFKKHLRGSLCLSGLCAKKEFRTEPTQGPRRTKTTFISFTKQ